MVRVKPNKEDLVPGFSGPSNLFRKMELNVGQTFTNNRGTKLIVESANFSDKWYVQALEEDTRLEKDTEAILSDIGIDSQHYEKQFHPDGTSKNCRIDFALPSIRLAIEHHEQEKEKEADLNEMGWDVLWLDDDLAGREQATAKIESTVHQVASNIEIQRNDNSLTLQKTPLDYNSQFSYKLDEDSTVVYQGEIVPRGLAMLKQNTRDANR